MFVYNISIKDVSNIMEDEMLEEKNIKKYLIEGLQTKITKQIGDLSYSLVGEKDEYIQSALDWLPKNLKDLDKADVFRKRTADEIISDQYSTGCSDDALVFIALCRAKGIPTKYIEAVKKDSDGTEGHVFAECYINGEWKVIDPARRSCQREEVYDEYDIIGIGLDSWDLEIGSSSEIIEKTSLFRT